MCSPYIFNCFLSFIPSSRCWSQITFHTKLNGKSETQQCDKRLVFAKSQFAAHEFIHTRRGQEKNYTESKFRQFVNLLLSLGNLLPGLRCVGSKKSDPKAYTFKQRRWNLLGRCFNGNYEHLQYFYWIYRKVGRNRPQWTL